MTIRRLTLDEYHRLIELGIFHEDERVELIEGVLHQMSPEGSRHAECVDRLTEFFYAARKDRYRIRIQHPLTIPNSHSEPEPDLALVVPREDGYADRHPQPEEVLLVVEVADTSVEEDRLVKAPLYATAGIAELWIVNLRERQVEVYRQPVTFPAGHSAYRERILYSVGDTLSPLQFPDCKIAVADLFP